MRLLSAAFRENTGLDNHELVKVSFFILKAIAAMGYLFVLGFLAAGEPVGGTVTLVLVLAAIVDLVPELVTLRIRASLPPKARTAEDLQLVLKVVAYLLLAAIMTGMAADAFTAYVIFAAIWLLSFLIEESVLFLVGAE